MTTVLFETHPDDGWLGASSLISVGLVHSLFTITKGGKEVPTVTMPLEKYKSIRYHEAANFASKFNLGGGCFDLEDGSLMNQQKEMLDNTLRQLRLDNNYTFLLPSPNEKHSDHYATSLLTSELLKRGKVIWYGINESIPNPTVAIPVNLRQKMKQFEEFYPSQKKIRKVMTFPDYETFLVVENCRT